MERLRIDIMHVFGIYWKTVVAGLSAYQKSVLRECVQLCVLVWMGVILWLCAFGFVKWGGGGLVVCVFE